MLRGARLCEGQLSLEAFVASGLSGRAYGSGVRQDANRSPHAGHSIHSKSTRLTSTGVMTVPHFGQTASRDARTFSRLTLRDLGIFGRQRLALCLHIHHR
jgi:hypothetical protein